MGENERETEADMIQRRAQAKAALDAGLKVGEAGENGDDQDVRAGTGKREAQDRAKGEGARSPVDSMHVDAPKKQGN